MKSPLEAEVDQCVIAIEKLRKFIDPSAKIFKVTKEEMRKDHGLRKAILNKQTQLFEGPILKSMEKEYNSSYQKKMDSIHSELQSSKRTIMDKLKEVNEHNNAVKREYMDGEEGIDKIPGAKDYRDLNENRLRQSVVNEFNRLKIVDPYKAQQLQEKVLKKNENDKLFDKIDNIDEIVKIYPGSDKGPKPEDDPEFYSEWFIKN